MEFVWGASAHVVVARELTKMHEEFLRGTVKEVREHLRTGPRSRRDGVAGRERFGICMAKPTGSVRDQVSAPMAEGLDEKEALKQIARERGVSKSDVYRELQRER